MPKRLEHRILEERKKLQLTDEQALLRIESFSCGSSTKEYLKRWIEVESYGGVGFSLFNCPPIFQKGRGSKVIDVDGKEYIDCLNAFSVNNLGLSNPEIIECIKNQAEDLIHYFDLPTPPRIQLSEKLTKIAPGNFRKKVLYAPSGSEAIEIAIKLVRWYTGKPFILTAYGDYHGRTPGAQSLTGGKGGMWLYHYPVPPPNAGIFYFPYAYCYRCFFEKTYPDCDMLCVKSLENLFKSKEAPFCDPGKGVNNIAAIIIEPMQSSAGYIVPPKEFLVQLKELSDKYEFLLVVDEIQAGLGRTGKMWACSHSGVSPDIITVGKSIAGGIPLSAVIGRKDIMDSWGPAAHVGTFAGTPLACSTANKVLEIMERDRIPERAAKMGSYFLDELKNMSKSHPLIGLVSGIGLYLALEFVKDKKTKEPASEELAFITNECLKEGLIAQRSGYYSNRLNLIPALTITETEIKEAVGILDTVIARAEKEFGYV